jgi:hypothetical protein
MISNNSPFKNYDLINKLPTDDEELTQNEQSIVEMLYPSPPNPPQASTSVSSPSSSSSSSQSPPTIEIIKTDWVELKDIFIATFIFVVLNLPVSERLFQKIIKNDNFYYKLIAKSLSFALLFFLINHFYLSKLRQK